MGLKVSCYGMAKQAYSLLTKAKSPLELDPSPGSSPRDLAPAPEVRYHGGKPFNLRV